MSLFILNPIAVQGKIKIDKQPKEAYSVDVDETDLILKYKADLSGVDPHRFYVTTFKVHETHSCDADKIDVDDVGNKNDEWQLITTYEDDEEFAYIASSELSYGDMSDTAEAAAYKSTSSYLHNDKYICFGIVAKFTATNGPLLETKTMRTVIKVYQDLPFIVIIIVQDAWANYDLYIVGILMVSFALIFYYSRVKKNDRSQAVSLVGLGLILIAAFFMLS
ncbi:hypothetical protein LCGC14_0303040 [marine sediment metagenome]|uniref:Uncharacterized protein n=1 Tax=marine sediment metagenome TaxID=412755 RepID=A0A0F9WVR7_9ZZZZ